MAKDDLFAGLEPVDGAGDNDPFSGLEPNDPFAGLSPAEASSPIGISMDIGDEYSAQPYALDMPGGPIGSAINRMMFDLPTPMMPNGFSADRPPPPFEPLPTQEMPPIAPIGGGEQTLLLSEIPVGNGINLPKTASLDMLPVRGGGGAVFDAVGGVGKSVLGAASDGTDVGKLTMGEAVALQAQRVADLRAEAQMLRQEAADLKSLHNEQLRLRGPVELAQMDLLERQNALDWQIKLRDAEMKEYEATKIANGAPPKMGALRSAAEAVPSTLGNLGIDIMQGGAQLLTAPISIGEAISGEKPQMQRDVVRKFDNMRKGFNNWFASDSFYDKDLGQQAASGVASLAGLAGVGLGARALGLSQKLSTIVAGALPQAANAWNEGVTRQQYDPTISEWKKWGAFVSGLGIGTTEALPISRAFERLENLSGGKVSQYFGILMAAGGEEMAQEGLQRLLENVFVQKLMYNDPNVAISDDVIGNALVGGLTGILGGGLAIGGKMTMDKLAVRQGLGSEPQPTQEITPEQIQQFVDSLLGQQKATGFETPATSENAEDMFAGLEPVDPTGNEASLNLTFPGTEAPVEQAAPVEAPPETIVPAPAGTVVPAPATYSPSPPEGTPPAASPPSPPQGATPTQQPTGQTGTAKPGARITGQVGDIIDEAADRNGVPRDALHRTAFIESRGNPNARNPKSSAGGLFQFIDGTWKRFGKGDKFDARASAEAGAKLWLYNRDYLRKNLGREPTDAEIYLAHQQGEGGAVALLKNPNAPVTSVVKADHVTKNGGNVNMTAGQFAQMWIDKYNGVSGTASGDYSGAPAGGAGGMPDEDADLFGQTAADRDFGARGPQAGVSVPEQATEQQRAWAAAPKVESPDLTTNTVSSKAGRIETKPIVVDISSIISSEMPDYPAEMQPRDRKGRDASDGQIVGMVANFDANQIMPSPVAAVGPPIVNDAGQVESGNGRMMMLRELYRQNSPKLAEYHDMMRARGFNIDGMRMPVLVQQRITPIDKAQMPRYLHGANKPVGLQMSAPELANVEKDLITFDMLKALEGRSNPAKSPEFVRQFFAEIVDDQERGDLVDANGNVSDQGRRRMQNALFALAYGDSNALGRIAEASDEDAVKGISNAMLEAAPSFARLNKLIEEGNVPKEFDIRNELIEAVNHIENMRGKGMKFLEYLAQENFLNPISPKALELMKSFYTGNRANSQIAIAKFLRFYADQAAMIDVKAEGLGIGNEPYTRDQLMETAQAKVGFNGKGSQGQFALQYGQGNEPTVPSSDGQGTAPSGESVRGEGPDTARDGKPQSGRGDGRGRPENGGRGVKPEGVGGSRPDTNQRPERDAAPNRNEEKPVKEPPKPISFTSEYSQPIRDIVTAWIDMLGMRGIEWSFSVQHPNRKSAGVTTTRRDENGVSRAKIQIRAEHLSDKAYVLETLAHEIGHNVQMHYFDRLPEKEKKAVIAAHKAWRNSVKNGTIGDLAVGKDGPTGIKRLLDKEGRLDIPLSRLRNKDRQYFLRFEEWFADQVARWAVTEKSPRTAIEKFFAEIGKQIKKLVAALKKKNIDALPHPAIRNFLNKQVELVKKGQMEPIIGEAAAADENLPAVPEAPENFAVGEALPTLDELVQNANELLKGNANNEYTGGSYRFRVRRGEDALYLYRTDDGGEILVAEDVSEKPIKDVMRDMQRAINSAGVDLQLQQEMAGMEYLGLPDREGGTKAIAGTTAPAMLTGNDQQQGASDQETQEIGEAFDQADQQAAEEQLTHVFDPPMPNEIVRMDQKVRVYTEKNGWMTMAEAKAEIQKWKDNAKSQGKTGANSDKIVLSLFDLTGQWSKPWQDAGYQVYRFDIQADPDQDVALFNTEYFMENFSMFDGQDVYAILAACPCTDFAASGARHFAAKDADGRTVKSVELVRQTLATIEFFKPSVWAIENPVGRIESLTGLPPWRSSFQPNAFGEDYTKRTLLWGRFNADMPIAPVEATAGSKMHSKFGGSSQATKNARSETPEGFAYAFFQANNAIDNPVMALANKYDRLDPKAIEAALEAGLTEQDIGDIVDDNYYMEMDDDAANQALRDAAAGNDGGMSGPAADVGENGRSRSTPMGEAFKEASVRYRGSNYTQAWVDAGLNPREAILLSPEQQIEILAKQFEAKYGIKVDLATRTQKDAKTFSGRTAPQEVDNYNAREVITQLLDGYQNIQALLASMGLPMSAANLALPNGSKLKLTFKSLQKNSTLGNYDPETRSITLSGRSNSFAHEYAHALDHYLMLRMSETKTSGDFLSKVIRNYEGKDYAPSKLQDAFANLINAMFYSPFAFAQKATKLSDTISKKEGTKAAEIAVKQLERLVAGASRARIQDSQFREDAKTLAALLGASPDYWSSAIEMLARSFEAYVAARIAQMQPGYDQAMITKGDEAYLNAADDRLRLAYPRDEDRRQIFMAWSEVFQAMQAEQIFGPSQPAQMPGTDNLFDISTLDRISKTPERKVGNIPLAMREEVAEAVSEVKAAWGKVAEGAKNLANDPFKAVRAGIDATKENADELLFTAQQFGYTTGGILHMLAERNSETPAVAQAFDELGRLVTTRPGRGEVVKQTFEEGITQRTAPFVRRIDEALRQLGLEKMTPREKEMLRELLTQLEEGKKLSAYPQKLKDMAFVIRATFDEIYDMMQKAGVPVAYLKESYLPRIFNLMHIDENANRFVRDAIELYGNEFDLALGDDASTATPEELLPILDKLLIEVEDPKTGKKVPARFAKTLAPIRQSIKKLVKALDQLEAGMQNGSIEPDVGQLKMEQAAAKMEDYINENLPAIRDAFAATAAERLMSAIRLGSATDFATKGPESGFTKVRSLSAAADQIMREWYVNDPLELAYTYIHQASTRAEYAQRFGAGGEKIEQLLSQAQGPMRPDGSRDWDKGAPAEHIRLARQQIELITGQISTPMPGRLESVVNFGMALGTLILLRGATIASIPEHLMVWQRSEDWKAPLRTMVGMWEDAINTADAQERHELALAIGVIANANFTNVVASQFNADTMSKKWQNRLQWMFRHTGLIKLTEIQSRNVGMINGHQYLSAMLDRVNNPNPLKADAARRHLADLGIDPEIYDALREYIKDGLPSIDSLKSNIGQVYSTALLRFTRETIQEAYKSDRPGIMFNPYLKVLGGIQSFNYSHQKKVLMRIFRLANADAKAMREMGYGKAAVAGSYATRVSMQLMVRYLVPMMVAQFLLVAARSLLGDYERWKEESANGNLFNWLFGKTTDKVGLYGAWSPIVNAFAGLTYNRDLTTLTAGPQIGYFLQNLQGAYQGFKQAYEADNPQTRQNRLNEAYKATYQFLIAPLLLTGLAATNAQANLIAKPLAALMFFGGSGTASQAFANAVAGEKKPVRRGMYPRNQMTLPRLGQK